MLEIGKRLLLLMCFSFVFFSCIYTQKEEQRKGGKAYYTTKDYSIIELTLEQETAFDALTTLQVNCDEQNRLFSTFANHVQPFYPPDTNFVISQPELLKALETFTIENYTDIDNEYRVKLIQEAVKAQKEYVVLLCVDNPSDIDFRNGPPMIGTWVMPNVLNRRDVIIVW